MWENCETHRGKGEGDGVEFILLLTITINCFGISQEPETVDPWTLKVWMLDPSVTTTLTSCQVATNHPTCPMKVFESLYNCYVWSTGTSWEVQAILPGKYSVACNGFELDLRLLVFGVFHVFSKSWRPMKMNFKTFIPWEGIARLHVCSKHKLLWHWKSASACYVQICDQSTCRGQPPA